LSLNAVLENNSSYKEIILGLLFFHRLKTTPFKRNPIFISQSVLFLISFILTRCSASKKERISDTISLLFFIFYFRTQLNFDKVNFSVFSILCFFNSPRVNLPKISQFIHSSVFIFLLNSEK
jgi:hypothetical protein